MAETPEKLPEGFFEKDRREQVLFVAQKLLNQEKAYSLDKSISGPDILTKTQKLFTHDIPEGTFLQNLSVLAKEKDSRINCPGRRQGYYLIPESAPATGETEPPAQEKEKDRERQERERLLYPIFRQWLLTQGYRQVKDTASARNRDLGTYGNPDITGLRRHKEFQKTTVLEFATIEVKVSADNWKSDIFEAVAHRRIANRCFFAFAYPEETINKIDPDLQQYGELYSIGILILPLEKAIYNKLTTDKKPGVDLVKDYTALDVLLYQSAPYQQTNYHFRDRFLEALGITDDDKLHEWGKASD